MASDTVDFDYQPLLDACTTGPPWEGPLDLNPKGWLSNPDQAIWIIDNINPNAKIFDPSEYFLFRFSEAIGHMPGTEAIEHFFESPRFSKTIKDREMAELILGLDQRNLGALHDFPDHITGAIALLKTMMNEDAIRSTLAEAFGATAPSNGRANALSVFPTTHGTITLS